MTSALFNGLSRLIDPLWKPIETRVNPILVKEVRQALRGRYFTVVFWLMTALATTIGCLLLVMLGEDPREDGGQMFFVAMYGCLSVAVHVFVPFSAFLAVGAEWEENTFDLLVLSNLRPFQIVVGKLLSAGVQVLLFYSAFGPFLVFAFLLRGLDLVAAGWVLGLTLVTSLGLSCLALCLSSLVRQRFARVLLMALIAVALVMSCAGSIGFTTVIFEETGFVHTPEFRQAALAFATGVLTVAAFSVAFATTRFTHPEENRSTGLRVLTTLVVVAAMIWAWYFYRTFKQYEVVIVIGTMTLVGLTAISTLFVTEEERLGRRVRLQVARNPMAAFLCAPYLPGGARGLIFYFLHLGFVLFAVVGLFYLVPNTRADEARGIILGVLVYLLAYVLVPTGIFARWTADLRWRVAARLFVPFLAAMAFVIPTVVGFLVGDRDVGDGEHPGNPFWSIDRFVDRRSVAPVAFVACVALLGLVTNVPRLVRSWNEVARCSRERRERELAAAETIPGAGDAGAAG